MRLLANYNDRGQVVLRWSGYSGAAADFGRYVVLRAPYPNRPDRPGQNGTQVVGQSTDPQRLVANDRPPLGTQPVYRVIALDASPGMLDALIELQGEHGVTDIEVVETRWPPPVDSLGRFAADVALIRLYDA